MYRENMKNNYYFLAITFSFFILVMASVVIFTLVHDSNDESLDNMLEEVGYESLESINPLVIDKSKHVVDKTASNIELADEIKRVYNIEVLYGNGTEALTKTVDSTAIYNQEDINEILLEMIECLEKYPSNIFKEIELKDYTVEICLVDYFTNNNIALATRDSNNNFKIYLAYNQNLTKLHRAVHHETYHILEYYMKLEYDINQLYREWNLYNPEDFVYEPNIALLNTDYVFDLDKEGRTYFVSIYSKVSEKEDRAEVFADTMIADKMPLYYTDSIGAIKNKMELISGAINKCFYSARYNPSVYWTRYF